MQLIYIVTEWRVLCLAIGVGVLLKQVLSTYEYTVAAFRHTRRGHQIPLQIVVSHHVVAGI